MLYTPDLLSRVKMQMTYDIQEVRISSIIIIVHWYLDDCLLTGGGKVASTERTITAQTKLIE